MTVSSLDGSLLSRCSFLSPLLPPTHFCLPAALHLPAPSAGTWVRVCGAALLGVEAVRQVKTTLWKHVQICCDFSRTSGRPFWWELIQQQVKNTQQQNKRDLSQTAYLIWPKQKKWREKDDKIVRLSLKKASFSMLTN